MSSQQPIGVCVIILDDANKKVLLGKRKNVYGDGLWGMPGGRISLREPIEQTVKREILEEVNLNIDDMGFVGVVREFQGPYDFVTFGFVSEEYSGELQNLEPEKCEKLEWFELNKLPEELLKSHKEILGMYRDDKVYLRDIT